MNRGAHIFPQAIRSSSGCRIKHRKAVIPRVLFSPYKSITYPVRPVQILAAVISTHQPCHHICCNDNVIIMYTVWADGYSFAIGINSHFGCRQVCVVTLQPGIKSARSVEPDIFETAPPRYVSPEFASLVQKSCVFVAKLKSELTTLAPLRSKI